MKHFMQRGHNMKLKRDRNFLPESTVSGITKTIYYRKIPGNHKGHIRLNKVDEDYIYHWLNRFVVDIVNKQFINRELFDACTRKDKDFPYGGFKNPNSILSYASGLCSNKYRNPSEDLTEKHIKHVQHLFLIMYNLYDGIFDKRELGYDLWTGYENAIVNTVLFEQA